MTTTAAPDYARHQALRTRLGAALDGLAEGFDALNPERARALRAARAHLDEDALRLMVVGEFKRGKSTLLNALLGADVLPAKVAPCTAVVTTVRRGEPACATLHYADPARAAETVPVERLRELVVIQEDDDEPDPAIESPYARVDVTWPRGVPEGVELVDSPGLNEHASRTRLALDHLATADALILVLSCQQPLTRSELDFLEQDLAGRNLRHVFFVWNHRDAVDGDPEAYAFVRRVAEERLAARAGTDARIFFVSARQALAGRLRGDAALLEASGVPALEAALETFLATERGAARLLAPLRTAERACREALSEALPDREALLKVPLAELDRLVAAEQPKLAALGRERGEALAALARRRDALVADVAVAYNAFVAEVERELPQAVAGAPVGAWEAIVDQQRARGAIADHLHEWLSRRLAAWRDGPLQVVAEKHATALEGELAERAQAFADALAALEPTRSPLPHDAGGGQGPAAAERLLTAVGGFLVGGPGAAIEGASLGWRGLTRGLVVHVGLGMALVALGAGGPLLLPILAAVGATRALWEATSVVDELRARVAEGLAAGLRQGAPEVARECGRRVELAYARLSEALDAEMSALAGEAAARVAALQAARAASEAEAQAAGARLAAVRTTIEAANRELDAVRFALEGG